MDRYGRLDVLVNNAGVVEPGTIETTTAEDYRFVMAVSADGTFFGCKHAIPAMKASGGGSIINMASIASIQGESLVAAYCAAKAGVEMLGRVAALELAAQGIRVASVGPGLTDTPMVARLLADPVAREAFLDNIPLQRPARPEDIAAAIAYLASDDAAYVTGQTLYVDGGASMQRYPSLAARKPSAPAA